MFSIHFLPKHLNESHQLASGLRLGKIVIGHFSENFEASMSYWDMNKYQENWKNGIERLLEGETKSSIITSMRDPKIANFIIWWPMYLVNNVVYFHNQILFLKTLKTTFDPEEPYIHISDRQTQSDNKMPISEWQIPIEQLEAFINVSK